MSTPQPAVRSTVEEYLALERASEERHEYLDGEIYLMAGESPDHGRICTNLVVQIGSQLRGTPCEAFSKDTKVRSGPDPDLFRAPKGLYSYPDVLVVCGEMKFHDEHQDVLVNPVVIIEVLSPATEAFDRGEKWTRYQTSLPTLSDYLLVSQSKPAIEHYRRQAQGEWLYSLTEVLDGIVSLESIRCTIRLADVYERIAFSPASAD